MIPVIQKTKREREPETAESFVVLIDKDEDWTSFDAVNKLRNFLKIKKVGHAGTLDPFATGLLIIGVGQATKMLNEYMGLAKIYEASIRFGIETDTYDRTGEVVSLTNNEIPGLDEIERGIRVMTGEIEQLPPMFSAKKVNGQRLYKLARKKKEIERQPVVINVHSAEIMDWKSPVLRMRLHVSKGTYIRTYAHDLGKRLNCGAHLSELRRLAIGSFSVDHAFRIPEFMAYWGRN